MPQVSNVISSSLNYKTSQKSGRVETNDSYLATISEEKHNRMNSHSILQLYCMGIKRSTEEIQMYAACNKTGTCFSKVPAINRPGKLLFTFKIDFSKLWKIT